MKPTVIKALRYLALILIFLFANCKQKNTSSNFSRNGTNQEAKSDENPSRLKIFSKYDFSELHKDNFRKSFVGKTPDTAVGIYILLDNATNEELNNLVETEIIKDDDSLSLSGSAKNILKNFFGLFEAKRKVSKISGTFEAPVSNVLQSVHSPTPNFVRKGSLNSSSEKIKTQPLDLISIKNADGSIIPVRTVNNLDEIPVGSGEFVHVTLTKKQYNSLLQDSNKSTWYRVESEATDSVTLKVADPTQVATNRYLATKKPLMFNLENAAHIKQWDTVKNDLETEDIDKLIKNGKLLGLGAFGTVYLIKNADGTEYALKKISAIDGDSTEISILTGGSCKDCLQYYGAIQKDKFLYLASEVASGGELAKRIETKPITNDEIISILRQGKQMADNRLINKDIKLENILITADGSVKIMDYGVAQRNPSRLTNGGSPHTIAPEVMRGDKISPEFADRVHTYSLAMTILDGKSRENIAKNYKVITKNNMTGKDSNISFVKIPPFTQKEKDILKKMLEPDITKRISIGEALKKWEALPRESDP